IGLIMGLVQILLAFIFLPFSMLCFCQESSADNPMLRASGKTEYKADRDDSLWHKDLPDAVIIDSIAIHKSAHEMQVFSHQQMVKTYVIHLGLHPVGPRQVNGDCKTPEGLYFINSKNDASMYHKSLGISYPNENDILEANKLGESPGGDIVIHGWPNGTIRFGRNHYYNDWTRG